MEGPETSGLALFRDGPTIAPVVLPSATWRSDRPGDGPTVESLETPLVGAQSDCRLSLFDRHLQSFRLSLLACKLLLLWHHRLYLVEYLILFLLLLLLPYLLEPQTLKFALLSACEAEREPP